MKHLLFIVFVSCSILLFSCRASRSFSSSEVEEYDFADSGFVSSAQIVSKDTSRILDTTRIYHVQDTLFIVRSQNIFSVKTEQKTDTVVKWKSCQHKELEIVQEKERVSRFPWFIVGLLVGFFLFLVYFLKK